MQKFADQVMEFDKYMWLFSYDAFGLLYFSLIFHSFCSSTYIANIIYTVDPI